MDEKREFWKIDVFDEKGYDWEENMTAFVKEFPDVQFYLEGNGENKDDWWVALFKGDKKQVKYCSPLSMNGKIEVVDKSFKLWYNNYGNKK